MNEVGGLVHQLIYWYVYGESILGYNGVLTQNFICSRDLSELLSQGKDD